MNAIFLVALLINAFTPVANYQENDYLHPFYVSVTEINHNAKTRSLEIACKIFTDDFEVELNNRFKAGIDLFNPKNPKEVEQMMAAYMKAQLLIFVNGSRKELKFIGYERESEAIWSYFEVSDCDEPKLMEIRSAVLYDSFKEQINLIHATAGGKRRSGKLDYPKTELKLNF